MFLESAADGFKVIIISALYTIIRINFNDLWFFIQLGILYFFNEWEKIEINPWWDNLENQGKPQWGSVQKLPIK